MSIDIVAAGCVVEAEMGQQELLLLGALPGLVATVAGSDDPAYERLYPAAYGDDDADREFRRFAAPEIERARTRDSTVFGAVLARLAEGRTSLNREEAEACIRTVGAGRLTIAARSGLFDQTTFDDAEHTPEGIIVGFLGVVQHDLVVAVSNLLEEVSR
jgi:hypothetical protein